MSKITPLIHTTSKFLINENYFNTLEECSYNEKNRFQSTNLKYPTFNYTHYTVGDEDQFNEFCFINDYRLKNDYRKYKKKVFIENVDNDLYKEASISSMYNTFNYMFYHLKKGIYVKIREGKLRVFLPFINSNYINNWHSFIDENFDLFNFLLNNNDGYPVNKKKLFNRERWYANNCLIRYEKPFFENDTGYQVWFHFLIELCKYRKVPDIDFFINKRDFPVLKKDLTEPYDNMFEDKKTKIPEKYLNNKFLPILSGSVTDEFADIPFVTREDMARIEQEDKNNIKYFKGACRNYDVDIFNRVWNTKIPTAVFRGASTGCCVNTDTNMRLKISALNNSVNNISDKQGYKLLDAGITKWNNRIRRTENGFEKIDIKNIGFDLIDKLTPEQQSNYKYIINVDGHAKAFRLSLELAMGSVVLLVDSKYYIWFMKWLKPYVHYVPVKSDLSDLFDVITWCRDNDDKCKEIADNGFDFYKKYLCKKNCLDYGVRVLNLLRENMRNYFIFNNKKHINNFVYEKLSVKNYTSDFPDKINFELIRNTRQIDRLNAVRCFFNGEKTSKVISLETLKENFDVSEDTELLDDEGEILQKNNINVKIINTKNYRNSFVSYYCINKIFSFCPNFRFTYFVNEKYNIVEDLGSYTLRDYILSEELNIRILNNILIQLLFNLNIAQNLICYINNNINCDNIILIRNLKSFNYCLNFNDIRKVEIEELMPVIYDHSQCYCLYDGYYTMFVNNENNNRSTDAINLIKSVIKVLIERNLDSPQLKNYLFTLTSLFDSNIKTFNKIKDILDPYYIISDDLKNMNCIDIVEYFNFPYTKISKTNFNLFDCQLAFDIINNNKFEFSDFLINFQRIQNCNKDIRYSNKYMKDYCELLKQENLKRIIKKERELLKTDKLLELYKQENESKIKYKEIDSIKIDDYFFENLYFVDIDNLNIKDIQIKNILNYLSFLRILFTLNVFTGNEIYSPKEEISLFEINKKYSYILTCNKLKEL